jgi:hypothetical protein
MRITAEAAERIYHDAAATVATLVSDEEVHRRSPDLPIALQALAEQAIRVKVLLSGLRRDFPRLYQLLLDEGSTHAEEQGLESARRPVELLRASGG